MFTSLEQKVLSFRLNFNVKFKICYRKINTEMTPWQRGFTATSISIDPDQPARNAQADLG